MTDPTGTAIRTDQKLLNEELIASIVEVAAINVQHCADLFELPCSVVKRIRDMAQSPSSPMDDRDMLLDLAMTPAPLWCFSLTVADVRRMLSGTMPMFAAELEPYRHIVVRLNRLVVSMLVRYASEPTQAALVCGVSNAGLFHLVQEAACASLFDVAGNSGRPLIEARLSHALLDRFFMTSDGQTADPTLRALVAMLSVSASEFSVLARDEQAQALQRLTPLGLSKHQSTPNPKRSGKAPSILLNPVDGKLVVQMLAHRVKPCDIERCLPDCGARALQIERLQAVLYPKIKDARDAQQVWASATRRMHATVVLLKQRALIGLGVDPLRALVEAFDFHVRHHAGDAVLSLPRLMKDVFTPMQVEDAIRFNHCKECGVVYLSNDHRIGPLDCPTCCMVYRKKLGHQRRWKNYLQSVQRDQWVAAA